MGVFGSTEDTCDCHMVLNCWCRRLNLTAIPQNLQTAATVTASKDQTTLDESKVITKHLVNPQYELTAAGSQNTYEDVDKSLTDHTVPNPNVLTSINNTASLDQATVALSKAISRLLVSTAQNDSESAGYLSQHTYNNEDMSATNPIDLGSNRGTARNRTCTAEVTADYDETASGTAQIDSESAEYLPQHTYNNEDMSATNPIDLASNRGTATDRTADVTASHDETASGCYQSETVRKSSKNPHYGSSTAVSSQCHYLYGGEDRSPRS
ncbi:hypothetical protein Bbelb_040030 [Branchiostoma belcheri]|nr:hypothetical protein Bbelb_040030 [Branchiostoma belcheri]